MERETGIPTGHPNSTVAMSRPNQDSILFGDILQPLPHGLTARFRPKEDGYYRFFEPPEDVDI